MNKKSDDLEEKINSVLERIQLTEENQQLKGKVGQLEKQLRPFQKPNEDKSSSALKGYSTIAGIVLSVGFFAAVCYNIKPFSSSKSYYEQAVKLQGEGHHDEAIDELDRVIHLAPENADAYWLRGNSYIITKEYDLAVIDLNKAIELKPEKQVYWRDRGFANYYSGKIDYATADFTRALELSARKDIVTAEGPLKTDFMAYQGRGECFFRERQYDKAISDYTHAIGLIEPISRKLLISPSYLYHLRAQAWEKKGDLVQSQRDYAKAKELGYKGEEQQE